MEMFFQNFSWMHPFLSILIFTILAVLQWWKFHHFFKRLILVASSKFFHFQCVLGNSWPSSNFYNKNTIDCCLIIDKCSFSPVLEAGSPKSRCRCMWCLARAPPGSQTVFSHRTEGGWRRRAPFLWPNHLPTTPHPVPSQWGLGFTCKFLENIKHLLLEQFCWATVFQDCLCHIPALESYCSPFLVLSHPVINCFSTFLWTSLVAQHWRTHLPTQQTRIWSLGREDPLEKEVATYSSILACEIPWTEEPGGYSPWGHKRVRYDWVAEQKQQHTFMLHNPVPPHSSNVILSTPQLHSHSPWHPPCRRWAPTSAPLCARSELSFLCRSCCQLHALCPLDPSTCLELFWPPKPLCGEFGPDPQNTICSGQFSC